MKTSFVIAAVLSTVGCVATQTSGPARRPAAAARVEPGGGGPYDFDRLPILSRALLSVNDNYVDPSRIDPGRMVVSALEAIEEAVPEVIVEGDPGSPKLRLTVGASTRDLDPSDATSIWKVRTVLGEALRFVRDHLVAPRELREIEHAAVNGALSTLDAHTRLLDPSYLQEMRLQTRGGLGGLGLVFRMRDGNLTVVKTLKNAPARRAGIQAKDVIAEIDGQSTVNMDLRDAVERMRGAPRSSVTIRVMRAGWTEPRLFDLTREEVAVESISHAKVLDGAIGYVKVTQFAASTVRDLSSTIAAQRAQAGGRLEGLVLDLRGNPGGLFEQAIKVSDLFLSEGLIVKTVGGGRRQRIHEVREASAQPDDLVSLPLVVIVNRSSAAGSEIVASALEENGRALVIGRPTFGQDTIQVLHDFAPPGGSEGEGALKLTVARFLARGDVSVKGRGVAPDVLFLPGRVLKEQVSYFAPRAPARADDLDARLSGLLGGAPSPRANPAADEEKTRVESAALELRYLLDGGEDGSATGGEGGRHGARSPRGGLELTPEEQEDEDAEADPDRLVEDCEIRFARDILERAPYADRARMLDAAKALVARRQEEERARLARRLGDMGVDWTSRPGGGTPRAAVTIAPPGGHGFRAGVTVEWTVSVENRGDAPLGRLRAWTRAEANPLLDRREFVFGTVRPGQRRSWTVPVRIPKGTASWRDEVTLHFEDDAGKAPPDVKTSFAVVEVPKPRFAFSVQIDDRAGGNGDGLAQGGETFDVRVDVRNVGEGASSEKTYVSLKNLGNANLSLKTGHRVLGALEPGESRSATFEAALRGASGSAELPVRVGIVDEQMEERVSGKVAWPAVASPERALAPASATVRVELPEAVLRSGAAASSAPIASATRGVTLRADARVGDFWRVEWSKGRFGFAASADVTPAEGAASGWAAEIWQREPPGIAIAPDPTKGAPVVDRETFRLHGAASVRSSADRAARLRDVLVFVGDRKVLFKAPEAANPSTLEFDADLPLEPGRNVVTVFAREDDELAARRRLVVYRRPQAVDRATPHP